MNDLNGRIVPDTSTANPPTYNTWQAADKDTLMNAVLMFEEANKKLNKENIALRADMAKLEAENAELREKCMTRFARIKNAANADDMAQMLHKFYMIGYGDALYYKETGKNDPTYNNVSDLSHYLQEIGKI